MRINKNFFIHLCPGRESNPHGLFGHQVLSLARLPIPPPGQKICAREGSNLRPRSYQDRALPLSYARRARATGFEPATSGVTGRRSDQAELRPLILLLPSFLLFYQQFRILLLLQRSSKNPYQYLFL